MPKKPHKLTNEQRQTTRGELVASGAQVIYDRVCTICGKEVLGALMSRTTLAPEAVRRGQRAVDTLPAFVCSSCSGERHGLWRAGAERTASGLN